MTSAVEVLMGVSSFLGLGFLFITNNPDTPALQLLHNNSYATQKPKHLPKRLPFSFICLKCPTTFEFMHLIDLNGFLAQAAAPQPGQMQGSPLGGLIVPMGLMMIIVYFLMIRPQSKQRKQQEKLLQSLKSGDKVITAGGIVGVVITVKEQTVSLRSADAKMEVTKSSVTQILEGGNAAES
jgi:preprotein translocase subunit YajC